MKEIRNQLVKHIKGGEAFMPIDNLLKFISFEKLCERPENLPYSFYEIFYHIRFAQRDILDYIKNDNYKHKQWPQDYWPKNNSIESSEVWESLKSKFFKEQQELIEFLLEPKNDIFRPVNLQTKHIVLREIFLVIEHNSYHTGQLMIVLRSLGLYPA
ncbi:DinB family protein [Gillisia sp. Hel_I_86]|uniref:DinB family protein n=1 Tax=Gillisia sp. Hel_I_86 TaxID=1249981 RepID=UPI00119BFE7A|nr:DinB family protein [Gillisia sp. Hel_I_86]TVZ28007.1 DinB family protein [Gillisia sp. Hel_I_86]